MVHGRTQDYAMGGDFFKENYQKQGRIQNYFLMDGIAPAANAFFTIFVRKECSPTAKTHP